MSEAIRPLVLLPTYNERENLEAILEAVFKVQPEFEVLVIDDASPDGTGELADDCAQKDARVKVLHRKGKEGLGRAYLAGFDWALASLNRAGLQYTHILEMDADFSHDPKYLGTLIQCCEDGADLSIGSRYIAGGGVSGWPWLRRFISQGGGYYARTILGLKVQDLTAGFVCYKREVLERLSLHEISANGYAFQIEMKYRAALAGFSLREIPIVFADRTKGASKMTPSIAFEALWMVWKLRFRVRKQSS